MTGGQVEPVTIRLPSADLGPSSPIPAFVGLQRLPDPSLAVDLPAEMRDRMMYGRLANPLPYEIQNGYGRELAARDHPAIRLANSRLEVCVLPELGGRVWSLRDRATGRDLIFSNSRVQYANFALTDAWCAGGIEWNLGSTGHAATTSRPVFAGSVETDRGPALRLWEWERTRDLVFSVDLLLPADRALLLAFVRVRNLDPETKPLYWWTNIAVPETPGVRVLAPARAAWRSAYDGRLVSVPLPHADSAEHDASYPRSASGAADYFFQIPDGRTRWVAAVRADGTGVVQTATPAMKGRKLFVWGMGVGGRRWQRWLCGPEQRYLEIQAGLGTTQLEHLQLPGGAEIGWAEAVVPMAADPSVVHGPWHAATGVIEEALAARMQASELMQWYAWWQDRVMDRPPVEQLSAGSGAGLAELLIRGFGPEALPGTPFERHRRGAFGWLIGLARTGVVDQDLAGRELLVPPISQWWERAFAGVAHGWWGALMLGIRAHATGDHQRAEQHYVESLARRRTPWALRGLAVLANDRGEGGLAADLYREAVGQEPACLPLLVEAAEHLLAAGAVADCQALLDASRPTIAGHGRHRLLRLRALLAEGRAAEARTLLEAGLEIPDLREGETVEAVWHAAYPDRPLPERYDFRMKPV